MTAVLYWWLSRYPDLVDRALSTNTWHTSVKSLREDDVGHAIYDAAAFSRAEDRFWQDARSNPATKHLVEQCVENWRSKARETGISGVRNFVKISLVRLLARAARERGLLPSRGDLRRRGV
jgi:hypothetical protein